MSGHNDASAKECLSKTTCSKTYNKYLYGGHPHFLDEVSVRYNLKFLQDQVNAALDEEGLVGVERLVELEQISRTEQKNKHDALNIITLQSIRVFLFNFTNLTACVTSANSIKSYFCSTDTFGMIP